MSRPIGALLALAMLGLAGCTAIGDPGWRFPNPRGCLQQYGTRGSTPADRPDVMFFCAESP